MAERVHAAMWLPGLHPNLEPRLLPGLCTGSTTCSGSPTYLPGICGAVIRRKCFSGGPRCQCSWRCHRHGTWWRKEAAGHRWEPPSPGPPSPPPEPLEGADVVLTYLPIILRTRYRGRRSEAQHGPWRPICRVPGVWPPLADLQFCRATPASPGPRPEQEVQKPSRSSLFKPRELLLV